MLTENKLVELYRLHGKELFVYIFRFVNSQETSEDILHDCFENIIKQSRKNEIDETNLRAYLYRTAHNLCVNFLKRHKKIEFTQLDEASAMAEKESSHPLELEELNKKIYELLNTLDDTSKSIFILKKDSKMTFEEIAVQLEMSERSIRRKMNKVVEFLSDNLKKSGFF